GNGARSGYSRHPSLVTRHTPPVTLPHHRYSTLDTLRSYSASMVSLESAELFRNLKPHELQALRLVTLEREFMNGQEILREGDPGDGVYLVKSGQMEISGMVSQGAR